MLERFAQTLINHWQGLITYFEQPITTGLLEGLNDKIWLPGHGVLQASDQRHSRSQVRIYRMSHDCGCKLNVPPYADWP